MHAWRQAHPGYNAETLRRWRERHPERVREASRRYEEANPGRWMRWALATGADKERKAKRRARLAGVEATLTPQEWNDLLEAYRHRCAYCGVDGPMTQDHVVPISAGGGHTKDNVVPACQSCNSRKGTKIWAPGGLETT